MILQKSRKDLVIAFTFLGLLVFSACIILRGKWSEWRETRVVTRAEALAFSSEMDCVYATWDLDKMRSLFFDDAIIRYDVGSTNVIELNRDEYVRAGQDRLWRPSYNHHVDSVEQIGFAGMVKVSLSCTLTNHDWPEFDSVYEYKKSIVLAKRCGQIGIVLRESEPRKSIRVYRQVTDRPRQPQSM